MSNVVSNNPNTSVAVLTGAVASVIVWVAGVAGLEMDAAIGTAIGTILIATVLGLAGFIKSLTKRPDEPPHLG